MTSDPQAPEIPQSNALAEASSESLTELMSRDPEGYGKQDIAKIIEALRAQRARWDEMERQAAASGKPKRDKTKADTQAILKKASGTAEDMGL